MRSMLVIAASMLLLNPVSAFAQSESELESAQKKVEETATTAGAEAEQQAKQLEKDVQQKQEAVREASSAAHGFGVHASVGLPYILNYGLDYVPPIERFSFSADFGGYGSKFDDVDVNLSNWNLTGRFHPFAGSFFFGLKYGQQNLVAKTTQDVDVALGITRRASAEMDVKTMYMTPHIGWQKTSSGFFISTDLGLQLPSSSSNDLKIDYGTTNAAEIAIIENNDDFKKAKKDAEDAGDKFGKATLPYWAMIRIGWMF